MLSLITKLLLRNLKKYNKHYFIKLFSLVLSLASAITMLLYVIGESSYNKHYNNYKNIYRVIVEHSFSGGGYKSSNTEEPLASELFLDYPEINSATRLYDFNHSMGEIIIKKESDDFKEKGIYLVDKEFFNLFDFLVIKGNLSDFEHNPSAIVVTNKIAKKYFGEQNPIGKTLQMCYSSDTVILKIIAVIKDSEKNSTININIFGRIGSNYGDIFSNSYFSQTYVFISEPKYVADLEKKIPIKGDENYNTKLKFQKLKDIYFNSGDLENSSPEPQGSLSRMHILLIISFLLILIAGGNYIILSNFCSLTRNTEVLIRKIAGEKKSALILSYISESIIITLVALPISLFICTFLVSFINNHFDMKISLDYLFHFKFFLGLVFIIVFVGIISGSYNAFYLSSLKPVKILTDSYFKTKSKSFFMKSIIIIQTAIFIILTFSILTIYNQLKFSKEKNLGFEKKNIINIDCKSKNFIQYYNYFKFMILNNSDIINVSASANGLMSEPSFVFFKKNNFSQEMIKTNVYSIDNEYIQTLGLDLLEGRMFSENIIEKSCALANETAIKKYELENPLSEKIEGIKIIGIIKDFNTGAVTDLIPPILIFPLQKNQDITQILVRIREGKVPEVLTYLKKVWKELAPDQFFEYELIENQISKLYKNEDQLMKLVSIFTIILILISFMGLVGISIIVGYQRIKELTIRKVLGSTISEITLLVFKEFIIVAMVSNIIAIPISFYIMRGWLQNYAYHIELSVNTYVFASGISFFIISLATFFNIRKTVSQRIINNLS